MKKKKVVVTSKKLNDFNPKIFYKEFFEVNNGEKRKIVYDSLIKNKEETETIVPTQNQVKQSILDLLTFLPALRILIEEKKLTLNYKEYAKMLEQINNHLFLYFCYWVSKDYHKGYDMNIDYLAVDENEE